MPGPVPMSRQAFLSGVAGAGAWAATGGARRSRADSGAARPAGVTVSLARPTGTTVQPEVYGYATGGLMDGGFGLAADAAVQQSARTLAPPLLRFNEPAAGLLDAVFKKGAAHPDWAPYARWSRHHGDFLRSGGRLVFGIGPAGGDTSLSPATWAQYARATAAHFRSIGQEITYWEVGNECDSMGAAQYCRYFNAIADALHAVHPAYLVGGPVSSWWNGIDLATFARTSGDRIGFLDFHSYPIGNTEATAAAYREAATFTDVSSARAAVAGTPAADVPIGLLEYNLNGNEQASGEWGRPAQGTMAGAVYVALLLGRAIATDKKFTMGGLWDLVADSNYGAIGNAQRQGRYRAIDEQGWYLRQAARLLPGQQVRATTSAAGLQVLATRTGSRFAVQLVNYDLHAAKTVSVHLTGRAGGHPVTRWELSAGHPAGHSSAVTSLGRVTLPAQSVVLLTGNRP